MCNRMIDHILYSLLEDATLFDETDYELGVEYLQSDVMVEKVTGMQDRLGGYSVWQQAMYRAFGGTKDDAVPNRVVLAYIDSFKVLT